MSDCRRCSECTGQEHHWLPFEEYDDTGTPFLSCKHCEATHPADLCDVCLEIFPEIDQRSICPNCQKRQLQENGFL